MRFEFSHRASADSQSDYLSIEVKFAFAADAGNRVSISAHGPQARERVVGLRARVAQLTEPQRIYPGLFHREPLITIAALVIVFGGLLWLVFTAVGAVKGRVVFGSPLYWYLTIATFTAFAYGYISVIFYPRCAFETRRWVALDNWRDWAVKGFIGALVFDVILVALLHRLAAAIGFALR